MNPAIPNQTAFTNSESDGTRRGFLGVATAAGVAYLGALSYPVYRYLASPVEQSQGAATVTTVSLPEAQKLPPGSALMFRFGAKPALLIHHLDGTWTALGAVCTHLGCTVQYQADRNRIYCACHDGVYDPKTGGNVSGPPPRPLPRYRVQIGEAAVVVSLA